MVVFKRNGDGVVLNNIMWNLYVIILFGWLIGRVGFLSYRNFVVFLFFLFSLICKKVFFMFVVKVIWLIWKVNSILGSFCIRLGFVCR